MECRPRTHDRLTVACRFSYSQIFGAALITPTVAYPVIVVLGGPDAIGSVVVP